MPILSRSEREGVCSDTRTQCPDCERELENGSGGEQRNQQKEKGMERRSGKPERKKEEQTMYASSHTCLLNVGGVIPASAGPRSSGAAVARNVFPLRITVRADTFVLVR